MSDPVFLPPAKELAFFRNITKEVASLFLREIEVHVIDRDETKHDELYGESKNHKHIHYHVRAQVELTPKKAVLKKFGLDEPRDLMVHIDVGLLEGLQEPDTGDLMTIDGEHYKVLDRYAVDYFGHQEQHLTWAYMCNRRRERSVDDTQPVDPQNPAGETTLPTHTEQEWFPGAEES